MATYTDLYEIANNNTLLDKFTAAVAVQAEAIRTENGATTNRRKARRCNERANRIMKWKEG